MKPKRYISILLITLIFANASSAFLGIGESDSSIPPGRPAADADGLLRSLGISLGEEPRAETSGEISGEISDDEGPEAYDSDADFDPDFVFYSEDDRAMFAFPAIELIGHTRALEGLESAFITIANIMQEWRIDQANHEIILVMLAKLVRDFDSWADGIRFGARYSEKALANKINIVPNVVWLLERAQFEAVSLATNVINPWIRRMQPVASHLVGSDRTRSTQILRFAKLTVQEIEFFSTRILMTLALEEPSPEQLRGASAALKEISARLKELTKLLIDIYGLRGIKLPGVGILRSLLDPKTYLALETLELSLTREKSLRAFIQDRLKLMTAISDDDDDDGDDDDGGEDGKADA